MFRSVASSGIVKAKNSWHDKARSHQPSQGMALTADSIAGIDSNITAGQLQPAAECNAECNIFRLLERPASVGNLMDAVL